MVFVTGNKGNGAILELATIWRLETKQNELCLYVYGLSQVQFEKMNKADSSLKRYQ